LNAVEREPFPTRVINPNANEASYKPRQRSYIKTKLKKNRREKNLSGKDLAGEKPRGEKPGGEKT